MATSISPLGWAIHAAYGTLYWCKGSNLDSAPDTNQMDVTDPSEPLINGCMSGGRAVLFSDRRGWVIMPNFFNAEATATGTSGSTWTTHRLSSIPRGLFIPRCLAISGGGTIFFRVDDGIHVSPGGLGSESITDGDLYPLFAHEGSTPQSVERNGVTWVPPEHDSKPELQQFLPTILGTCITRLSAWTIFSLYVGFSMKRLRAGFSTASLLKHRPTRFQ